MAFTNPSVSDFKARFYRDFPYTDDQTDFSKVQDRDIQAALDESPPMINSCLFGVQAEYSNAFLYLAAHMLCINLQNSSQGINGSYNWLTNSKSVGSVSQGFTIPDHILANPLWAAISQTTYGMKYLMIMLPKLAGAIFSVHGETQP